MGIYLPNMEMPQTGLYFVSVDNSKGRNKTVVTVERMLGNRDVRQIVGMFELIPVPPHGRLGDLDAAIEDIRGEILERQINGMKGTPLYIDDLLTMWQRLEDEELIPTIIPADKEGET